LRERFRRGDQFIVEFDLPGVEPASIDLTVEKNVLSVRSERRFEPREGGEVIVAERPHGTYTRQLFLGDRWTPRTCRPAMSMAS
jgi:HSP20 family protein